MRTTVLAIAAAASTGAAGAREPSPTTDWSARLADDARALHRIYSESHPGAVDPENPGFRGRLDRGLAGALGRAKTAKTFPDYLWAMREYVAGFDDGHVQFSVTAEAPRVEAAWPGFLTREDDGAHRVAVRDDGVDVPPLGATLVSCDGRKADRLAVDLVGRWRGLWNLAAQHERHAWRLFLDAGNRFVARPTTCVFSKDGETRSWTLRWRPLSDGDLQARSREVAASERAPIEMRRLAGGAVWISAGTFNGDLSSEAGKRLSALLDQLESERDALEAAPFVVLDVRGNSGGSSRWGDRIAAAVWSEAAARAAKPSGGAVDWRVSDANLAEVRTYLAAAEVDPEIKRWAGLIAEGLEQAKTEGRPLWRQPGGAAPSRPAPAAGGAAGRKVFVLTDSACASACLDALDVWLKLGAVHVGGETSADSPYMEIRQEVLPSGVGRVSVPMKVYRDRTRGPNQPYRPAHRLTAPELRDPAALEAAVVRLAAPSGG